MMDHLNQMDTQESTVKVDLLHLDPTDPDGAAAAAITAADIAADGTVTDRRTSLMRKSEK